MNNLKSKINPEKSDKNYTKSELKVINALRQMSHPTAEDIYFKINSETTDDKIGLTSVYRAIKKLENSSEVKQINLHNDGKARYEINSQEDEHHHFVCLSCNKVIKIDFCPFEFIRAKLGESYKIKYHNFEIFGLCPDCDE